MAREEERLPYKYLPRTEAVDVTKAGLVLALQGGVEVRERRGWAPIKL